MSLRAFHILFIALSVLMAAACSAWAFLNQAGVVFGGCSALVSVGLVVYGVRFLSKTRNIIV
ncbi:MAG: hypothetical protein RLZZ253_1850 [Verrucomicrobiota bacterium]|jgi:hypothetical protein